MGQTNVVLPQVELSGTPTSFKCSGYYDVEAVILVLTDDARLLSLRSNQQPMQTQPMITMDSPVVDIAFNGTVIAVATSDHAVKCYTLQVLAQL